MALPEALTSGRRAAAGLALAAALASAARGGGPGGPGGAPPPAARYTAAELRARVAEAQARLKSIRVDVRADNDETEGTRRAGAYTYRRIIARAPSSFLHISAHGLRGVDWRLDPAAQHAILGRGRARNVYEINRAYVEEDYADDRPLPGTLPYEVFLHATGLFPLTGRPGPRSPADPSAPSMLRDVAASPAYDHVRPAQEPVGGRWCHVLEWRGHDALWLDTERGCPLMARETYQPETGVLMGRSECGGHRELDDGIWVPAWIRNVHYDFLSKTGSGRPLFDHRLDVVQAEVNSATEEDFLFPMPPGALLLNGPGEVAVQTVPGGQDHLDDLVRWSRTLLKGRWDRPAPGRGPRAWSVAAWVVCGLAVAQAARLALARGHRAGPAG